MIRFIGEAAPDRKLPPLVCDSVYAHLWVEYGDVVREWVPGEDDRERDRVLLVLCSRCHQTPEEATR